MRPFEKNDPRERLIEELRKKEDFYQNLLGLNNIKSQEIIKKILFNIKTIIRYIESADIYIIEKLLNNRDLLSRLRDGKSIEKLLKNRDSIKKLLGVILSDTVEIITILENINNNGVEWYIIYSKLAKALNQFYNKFGDKSGEKLFEKYKELDSQYEILPWVKHFNEYNVSSLDPIHIFASFTYWNIPLDTRKKKMLFFCKLLKSFDIDTNKLEADIDKSIDSNYQYFPHPNITYIVSARNHKTQKEVWEFFSLVQNADVDNEKLQELFNKINENWYGVKLESATIFSFWINSDNFLPLDKNTLELLKKYNKVSSMPNKYEEYQKLLEKKDTPLYRNLAKIANDENLRISLTNKDLNELNNFLTKSISIIDDIIGVGVVSGGTINQTINNYYVDKNDIKIKYINTLEKIKDFEFELYFIVSGKAKRIAYKNEKLESIVELQIESNDNISYNNFQLIAIKSLNRLLEKLKNIQWFQSGKPLTLRDFNYQWAEFCKKSNNKYTKVLTPNKLYYFNKNFEILDNKTLKINSKNNIDLYQDSSIDININITAIVGKNGTGKSTVIDLLLMALNNIAYADISLDEVIYPLRDLFYTIHTNYSIYSLNTKDYDGDWIDNLFHKKDHYQIPIVIEPFRENGNIDVNVLNKISKQRLLSTILEPNLNIDNKEILEDKRITHFNITINLEKINKILDSYKKDKNIDEVLNISENKEIIKNLKIKSKNKTPKYEQYAKLYICYKVKSIADTYFEEYKDKMSSTEFLKILLDDKTHITYKLHQAINYLKYNTVEEIGEKVSIENLSSRIKKLKDENSISTIELIPPSFFKVNIIINDNIPFNTLSSGEKQKVYSISSIIYHLQNINSVHNSNQKNIIKYTHVNLILDEIELYFHPDMQRTYIYDLLEAIKNIGGLNYISALNIIMVTHSPFILSDIVESNIMYLGKRDEESENTFGANIHTLLDNSFFMEDGLMGKFAKEKINTIFNFLKTYDSSISNVEIQKIINSIGEPFLREKLQQMYNDKYPKTDEERIKALKEEINRIENG